MSSWVITFVILTVSKIEAMKCRLEQLLDQMKSEQVPTTLGDNLTRVDSQLGYV